MSADFRGEGWTKVRKNALVHLASTDPFVCAEKARFPNGQALGRPHRTLIPFDTSPGSGMSPGDQR
jgi:hypothetical protein